MAKSRILIIDDEEAYVDILKINLEGVGTFEVDCAADAMSGFQKLREHSYDLILLDILMPKIEGHEALGTIKKICSTPVIVMSGYLTPPQRELILRAGASGCFLKDSPFDEIHRAIAKILSNGHKNS
jgi:two-component system response regulator VicR